MPYSDEIARAVLSSLQAQLKSNTFPDVTVTVQNRDFRCHRVILCACSEFFNDKLQNPHLANVVVLETVSAETFNQVLECIYGGEDVLTEENASEIWLAAHKLKIDFLYKACEQYKLARVSVDNCVEMNNLAKELASEKVKKEAWIRIVRDFQTVYSKDGYLSLDIEDMMGLVHREDLNVSCEDLVVMSVLKWVNHFPEVTTNAENDDGYRGGGSENRGPALRRETSLPARSRKDFLHELLSSCRLFLASGNCLQNLVDTNWVIKNKKVFSLIREALRYQQQAERRGFHCPPQAVHRSNSPFQNVIAGVYKNGNGSHIFVFRTSWGVWYRLGSQSSGNHIAAHGKSLYFLNSKPRQGGDGLSVRRFNTASGAWQDMPSLASNSGNLAMICLNHYIYALDVASTGIVQRLNILEERVGKWERAGKLAAAVTNVALALCGSAIVVLGYEPGAQEITIQSFDTLTKECSLYTTKLTTSASSLVTFQLGPHTYILMSTGEVWQLIACDRVAIKMIHKGKLFAGELPLMSAVTFKDELLLSLSNPHLPIFREWNTRCVDNLASVTVFERPANCLLNAVIPSSLLTHEDTF